MNRDSPSPANIPDFSGPMPPAPGPSGLDSLISKPTNLLWALILTGGLGTGSGFLSNSFFNHDGEKLAAISKTVEKMENKIDKVLDGGALLKKEGFDEGVDRVRVVRGMSR